MYMSNKKEYTAEDAWRFAVNMVFADNTPEHEWYIQYFRGITDISFNDVIKDYNTWLKSRNGFHIGYEVENKDGRRGYIVKVGEKTIRVFYFNGDDGSVTDFDVATEWISDCRLTGRKNDSIHRLFEGR